MSGEAMGGFLHNTLSPAQPGVHGPWLHEFQCRTDPLPEAVEWLRLEISGDLARAQHILGKRGNWPGPRREMHDAIADAEAKLAILDLHHLVADDYTDSEGQDRSTFDCDECDPSGSPDNWPCQTVRLLASAYRHRDGFGQHWGPAPTHTIAEAGQ